MKKQLHLNVQKLFPGWFAFLYPIIESPILISIQSLTSFGVYYCFNDILLFFHTWISLLFVKSNLYLDFTPTDTLAFTLELNAVWYEILLK